MLLTPALVDAPSTHWSEILAPGDWLSALILRAGGAVHARCKITNDSREAGLFD